MRLLFLLAASDAIQTAGQFDELRRGFADFLIAVFGLITLISLVATIICVIKGDREGVQKLSKWFFGTFIFYVLMVVVKNL